MSMAKYNFEDYKNNCFEEIQSLQDEFIRLYDINSYENWFYDHGIGVFNFKSDDGRNLYFKYVDVGSFSTINNTWNWSWDNKSTPYNVKRGLEKVIAFGELYGFEQLTQGLINGDEYTGWDSTVITAKLLSALGMYRIPSEHLFIYFIFTSELNEVEYNALKDKLLKCKKHESGFSGFCLPAPA